MTPLILRRRVSERGYAFGAYRGHHCVLGRRDRRLIEKQVGSPQVVDPDRETTVELDRGPQGLESEEVRIHPAPSYDVPPRGRELDLTETGQKRTGQEDGGPNALRQSPVDDVGADAGWVDRDLVWATPAHLGSQRRDDLEE